MIKLIVDSTSEIDVEEAKRLDIDLIPMKVMIDDNEYIAGINLDNLQFYELLKKCKNLPTTTQINQTEYIEHITKYLDEGFEVFVMCLSSGLSGSFNSLRLAKEEINSDKLEIYDTKSATFGYKTLVYEALKLIKKEVSLQELKNEMETLKSKLKLIAIIDNVKYLIKGGRLSLVAGIAATALNIKPIVEIKDGKVAVLTKAIGFNSGLKNLCNLIKNIDSEKTIFFGHSNDEEKLNKMSEILKSKLNITTENISDIGSVIGTHAGPSCVGLSYFEK